MSDFYVRLNPKLFKYCRGQGKAAFGLAHCHSVSFVSLVSRFSCNIDLGLNSYGQQWSRNLLLFVLLWFAFLEGFELILGDFGERLLEICQF